MKWVLSPAVTAAAVERVTAQREVAVEGRTYWLDYEITGDDIAVVVELDGYEFHSARRAFTYDRMRQNDLAAYGYVIVRFSYDAIRLETARCVEQLQSVLATDSGLRNLIAQNPVVSTPDDMDPDPLYALRPALEMRSRMNDKSNYFDSVRDRLNQDTLRTAQQCAFAALANYYLQGGRQAACVMAVGSGKTALGVAAMLGFSKRRAMVITPGSVIRGTFDRALDHCQVGNVLYGLPDGPLIPGSPPPSVLVLDRDEGAIRNVTRDQLLSADVLVTNFHSLGTGEDEDDLLNKLQPGDVDFIVVDEAHIAASESYQRAFHRFPDARKLLMSACFQRLDGRAIDADVVYRYLLVDSIIDGHAKQLRLRRFAPESERTTYEIVWPDGFREEIVGREALQTIIRDESKLARITARSAEPIRHIMRVVRTSLDEQAVLLNPVKPRVLFAALGQRHAEQIAKIANEHGIPTEPLHHTMSEGAIKAVRERYESDSGDLQGIVQLRMLGQGYDFPPICIVVPMRPYGSFSEFYQFIGRGIRTIRHPALIDRVPAEAQWLDVVYHAEFGLDEHIQTIYRENDMDPITEHLVPDNWLRSSSDDGSSNGGVTGTESAGRPEAFVMFERGAIERRIVHDEARVEQRRQEREKDALARKYSEYAQATENPVSFEQYIEIMRQVAK